LAVTVRAKGGFHPARKGRKGEAMVREVPRAVYLVLWWHLQRMYVGLFENETEATLHAAARNGVVVELLGPAIHVGVIEDYWRRDESGKPMPGEWRTSRAPLAV
jgi:hypothetical protein